MSNDWIEVSIRCTGTCPNRAHGSFPLSRSRIRNSSKVIYRKLSARNSSSGRSSGHSSMHRQPSTDGSEALQLDCVGRGYSCEILATILSLWVSGGVYRHLTPHDGFVTLVQLSQALWEYECSTNGFQIFAEDQRDREWSRHYSTSSLNSQSWAFISVVFGWPDIFFQSAMDIPELATPRLSQAPGNRWADPVFISVPAAIIPPHIYVVKRNLIYNWIHSEVCWTKTNFDSLGDHLYDRFRAESVQILLRESEQCNRRFLSERGAVQLVRIIEASLRPQTPPTRRHPSGPRASMRGFTGSPTWPRRTHRTNAEDSRPGVVQERINWGKVQYLESMPLDESDIAQRFQDVRAEQLILGAEQNFVAELPPQEPPGLRELVGSFGDLELRFFGT